MPNRCLRAVLGVAAITCLSGHPGCGETPTQTTGGGGGGNGLHAADGVWDIYTASGTDGRNWRGLMWLHFGPPNAPENTYTAQIHWRSDDDKKMAEILSGTEAAELFGRNVTINFKSWGASGDMSRGHATYMATLGTDGKTLSNGSWTDATDAPGRWAARWLRDGVLGKDEYPLLPGESPAPEPQVAHLVSTGVVVDPWNGNEKWTIDANAGTASMARPDGTGTVNIQWTVPPANVPNGGVSLNTTMTITGIDIAWSVRFTGTYIAEIEPFDELTHHVRGIVGANGTVAPDTWTGTKTYTAKPLYWAPGGRTGSIDVELRLGPKIHYNYVYTY